MAVATEAPTTGHPHDDGADQHDPAVASDTALFEQHEAKVRSYCRCFPAMFASAEGARLTDTAGRQYIDFFMGAGGLNYGHNHPAIKRQLLQYIEGNGVTHSLDMYTVAKRAFIDRFCQVVLEPRGMDYKLAFPGPTGTNAVEMALKIARRATDGRTLSPSPMRFTA